MTAGLLGGLAGAAAGAVGAAAGAAAEVVGVAAGAAAEVVGVAAEAAAELVGAAAGVVEAVLNVTEAACLEFANFAVAEHCKKVGGHFKLVVVLSASLTVGPRGKLYRFRLQVETYRNGTLVILTYNAWVLVPWIGLPILSTFECCDG